MTTFYAATRVVSYKQLCYATLMMLIHQYHRVDLFIALLEHWYHENPPVVCTNNQRRIIYRSIYYRISRMLIWEEKLELVLVVDVFYNKWIEVDRAGLNSLLEKIYVVNKERDFKVIAKLLGVVQIFDCSL
jgi:hypothetical protein